MTDSSFKRAAEYSGSVRIISFPYKAVSIRVTSLFKRLFKNILTLKLVY